MNQLYRALHMPPRRLWRKLRGEKELYTIAVRRCPEDEDCEPLPALGQPAYTPLPYTPGQWYADPQLYTDADGRRWLFCEAYDMELSCGSIAVAEFAADGTLLTPRTVLKEAFHLSFPTVFDWRGETWMIPETGADHSLSLYRCIQFPDVWEKSQRFPVECELCDTILTGRSPERLILLGSETRPDNQLYTRYRRYLLKENTDPDSPGEFELEEDDSYNLQHRMYSLDSRNAGPLFTSNGQIIRPAQVSTTVDYGVYLQFWVRRGASEIPLCAAMPQNVSIDGIAPQDIIGIHSYCRDRELEIIDVRYLRRP